MMCLLGNRFDKVLVVCMKQMNQEPKSECYDFNTVMKCRNTNNK